MNADVNRALAASDDYMQVLLAEKVKGADGDATRGASVKAMADTAKRLGMYIVFGLPEMPDGGPIVDADGVRKVYNSAAVAFPDGHTESFQKMHRAGQEEKVWSVPGNTPLIFEMPEFTGADGGALKAGVSICRDGHFYPELGRYYAASGAELLIHPTATTGDPWYRESRIGSYTDRDGLAAVTANLWGQDGYPLDADGKPIYSVDANGDTISSGKETKGYNYMGVGRNAFRSTSLIITAWNGKDGTPFDYATGSAPDTSGTGGGATPQITKDWAFGEGLYDPDNLETRTMNLRSAGFRITNSQARLYSKMYDALAARTIDGYTPMYTAGGALDVSALAEPIMKAREVMDAADGANPSYTEESVAALADALLTAQALADNTTFSAEQQPLVTAAKDMLDTDYAALVPVGAEPEPGDGPADGTDNAEAKDPVKDPDDGATTSDRPATSDKPGADGMGSNDAATAAWDGDATQAPLSYTGSSAGAVAALALAASGAGVTLLMIRRRTQRG